MKNKIKLSKEQFRIKHSNKFKLFKLHLLQNKNVSLNLFKKFFLRTKKKNYIHI